VSHVDVDEHAARMVIALGSDHLGAALKQKLSAHLAERGYAVKDFGGEPEVEVDYPDVAVALAQAVVGGGPDRGILVCGTGLGMAISANKVPGVRAASVTDVYSAERASRSNDVHVLCLGSLVVGEALALALVDKWLESDFDAARSGRKVAKIEALDAHYRDAQHRERRPA
jgi:ribose 5-phosphate isomerase B